MAKKLFTLAIMMIAAISFISCEKDIEAEAWNNGGNPTPDPDPEYTLTTEHVKAELAGNKILDDHKAILKKDYQVVENHEYTATHEVSYTQVTLKRAIAETLQDKTVAYTDGFDLAGSTMIASIELINCETVFFTENDKTYCHSQFVEDGAIAALGCCNPRPATLHIGSINGNVLNAMMTIADPNHDSVEYPVEIAVVDDDVRTVEYSDATVKTSTSVEIIKTVKVNGQITETTPITVSIKATLECGEMITTNDLSTLAYGNDATVVDGQAAISMNIVSFTAVVNMPATVSFTDEGETHTANVVYNSLYVTNNGNIKVEDNSAEDIDILNTAYFKLVCDGIEMASDDKQIRQTRRVYAEFEKEEGNTVYFILHGNEDIRFTAPSGISLVAGADQTKVVTNLSLSANGRNNGNWTANGTQTVNNVKFTSYRRTDSYSYSNGINNTVTLTKNDNYAVVYNGHEYAVEMPEVSVNAAAPAAGNVVVNGDYKQQAYTLSYTASRNNVSATDETVVTLKKELPKPTIDGTKMISGYITEWYKVINGNLTSQGQIMVTNHQYENNQNLNILVIRNLDGTEIARENAENVGKDVILSVVDDNGKMAVASLINVSSTTEKPIEWRYDGINTAKRLPVDRFEVLAKKLANPFIDYAKASSDGEGMVLNGIFFK